MKSGYTKDPDRRVEARWKSRLPRIMRAPAAQSVLRDLIRALDAIQDRRLPPRWLASDAIPRPLATAIRRLTPPDEIEVVDGLPVTRPAKGVGDDLDARDDDAQRERPETPRQRWLRVRAWARDNLVGGGQ